MEAKLFRQKQQEKEESMSEEHHEQHQEASYNPTPPTAPEYVKAPEPPQKPDQLQGLSEDEALAYAATLPDASTSASGPSTEFHIHLHEMLVAKKAAKERAIQPATHDQVEEAKKKIHRYRVAHALEVATKEELEKGEFSPHSEASSGQ